MQKRLSLFILLIFGIAIIMAAPNVTNAEAVLSATSYKVGDTVTVEGSIDPGADLYIAISSQTKFAPKDTKGPHEIKKFKKEAKKHGFTKDTSVPVLYYMVTNKAGEFGKTVKKKFGGPSFIKGIYNTTMFKLKKFDKIDPRAKSMLAT